MIRFDLSWFYWFNWLIWLVWLIWFDWFYLIDLICLIWFDLIELMIDLIDLFTFSQLDVVWDWKPSCVYFAWCCLWLEVSKILFFFLFALWRDQDKNRFVKMSQLGPNLVHISGAKGLPPTKYLKISATRFEGFRGGGMLMIGGIDAAKKAR